MKWTIAIDSRLETEVVSESMDDNTTNTDEFAALRGAINDALATSEAKAPDATPEVRGAPAPSEFNYCDLCDRYDSLIERKPWGELCSDCWFYVYDKNDPSEIDDRSESMTYTPLGSYSYTYKAAPLFKQISCVATPPESWDDGESDADDDEDIGELMPVEILEDMHDMEWATELEDL